MYRDQKTIDIENRASYVALRQRWEVLDVTIQIPDDEMVKSVPPYMKEGSEDEGEEEETNSPSDDTLDTQSQSVNDSCPVCNSRQHPDASKDSEIQPTDQQFSEETDHAPSLTSFSGPDRDIQSVGETTDTYMASSDTQCTCRPSVTSVGCSDQAGGSSQQCELPSELNKLCEHLDGRLAPVSSPDAEKNPKCGCKFRRKSGSDILDEDGMALFNILEFPSKVRRIISINFEKLRGGLGIRPVHTLHVFTQAIDPCKIGTKKSNSSRHVVMAMEFFLNNANGPSNYHTKFEIFSVIMDFIKIFEVRDFLIGLYCGGMFLPTAI